MLDELSLALPRFRSYAETLQLTNELESGLVDVYTEMTCFCARAVRFFRSSPHSESQVVFMHSAAESRPLMLDRFSCSRRLASIQR